MDTSSSKSNPESGLGTRQGVLLPSLSLMLGVVLFLRFGVLGASAGLMTQLGAIVLSFAVMALTTLSTSALVSNMKVGAGGIYYIISRTLGFEIGGAVGLVLYVAQLMCIALTVSGVSLPLHQFYPDLSVSLLEFITISILTLVAAVGSRWTLRMPELILAAVLISIGSIALGSPDNLPELSADAAPFYTGGELGFWSAFAVFFPAMAGLEASTALATRLRDPGRSLSRGCVGALAIAASLYAVVAVFIHYRIPQEHLLTNEFALLDFAYSPIAARVGVFAATLSLTLRFLMAAPQMLKAMSKDGVISGRLTQSYGRLRQPPLALLVTYVLASIFTYLTTIDQVLPILTIICLISYALLNTIAALSGLMNTPSWKPRFPMSWRASAFGALLTIVCLFVLAPGWSFLAISALIITHIAIRARDLDSGFQDLKESFFFFLSRLALYRLGAPVERALTWHPQLLALFPTPKRSKRLVYLVNALARRSGLLTFASVVSSEWQASDKLEEASQDLRSFFEEENINCLCQAHPSDDTWLGQIDLVKAYGFGPIQPNTVVVEINDISLVSELVELIATCQMMKKNILLVKDSHALSEEFFTSVRGVWQKPIDIFWNPEDAENFDLTMSLVSTLTDGRAFNGAPVTIRGVLEGLQDPDQAREFLGEYIDRSQLNVGLELASEEEVFEKPDEETPPASLTFLGLEPLAPYPTLREKQDYLDYLRLVYSTIEDLDMAVLVTSYDQLDHRAIYLAERTDAYEDFIQ